MWNMDWSNRKVRQKFYQSKEWRDLRLFILTRDPICKKCGKRPSIVVDHKIDIKYRPDLRLDPKNLQGLCDICHNIKTKTDNTYEKINPIKIKTFKNNYEEW